MEKNNTIQKAVRICNIYFWFTMSVAISFLLFRASEYQIDSINIAILIDALTPGFWETITGGSVDNPTDFLTK